MVALFLGVAAGTAPPGPLPPLGAAHAQSAVGDEQLRQLIRQKLMLLENLLNSPRMTGIPVSDNAEAKRLLVRAQELLGDSRAAIEADDLKRAGPTLDEALRTASIAAAQLAKPAPKVSVDEQQMRNAEMLKQIQNYRGAIDKALSDAGAAGQGGDAVGRLDRLIGEAESLIAAGHHGEAHARLAEAYKLAVTAVSELRAGQSMMVSLNFETPADEFEYEQKRNQSHEMLVQLVIAEGRATGPVVKMIERFVGESRRLRTEADGQATAGDYPTAIATMEQATRHLIRALQAAGLPVSE